MFVPDDLYSAALHSTAISFYCPYGHSQSFTEVAKEEPPIDPKGDNVIPFKDGA